MSERKREWGAINRFSKGRPLKGCWLVDPEGNRVATILDGAVANQIAAAMNMTTLSQRVDWIAERAGFKKSA